MFSKHRNRLIQQLARKKFRTGEWRLLHQEPPRDESPARPLTDHELKALNEHDVERLRRRQTK